MSEDVRSSEQLLSSAPGHSTSPGQESYQLDLWALFRRHTALVLIGPIIGVILALLMYARTDAVFESSTQLLIQEKLNALPVDAQSPQTRMPFSATQFDHGLVLSSPLVVGQSVQKTAVSRLPTIAASNDPIGAIRQGLHVSHVSKNSNVLELRFRGPNASDCPEILDSLVATYREFLIDSESSVSQEAIGLIRNAEQNLNQTLEKQYRDYENFRKGSPLVWKEGEAVNIYQERQASIEDKRNSVALRNSELASKINAIESGIARDVDPDALLLLAGQDPSEMRVSAAADLSALLVELKTLSKEYGRGHPKIKSLQRRIDAIRELEAQNDDEQELADQKALAKDMLKIYLAVLHEQMASGEHELKQLAAMSEEQQADAERLAAYLAKDGEHLARIERTQGLFDAVVQRLQEISLVDDVGGDRFTVQVLSPAGRGWKVEPNLTRFAFSGIAMGLLAGCGLAYLVDRSDQTFRSPEDVSQTLRLPMVGHIHQMSPQDQQVSQELSELAPALVAAHQPRSHWAESYRAVRTALYFRTRSKENQVIQVTSPVPGDGKSTLAANLAITIAQTDKRVLLIDADFRLPVVHHRFNLQADVGLASVVGGDVDPPQAIQQTEVTNLWAMACGSRPDNPSELLSSPEFAELLDLLREQFDFVIVDTPPLLAVTDPSIVAVRADGVLLAVRLNKEARSAALRAVSALQDLDANVLGVVVNGVLPRASSYGSGYSYGYGYGGYGVRTYGSETPDRNANGTSSNGKSITKPGYGATPVTVPTASPRSSNVPKKLN